MNTYTPNDQENPAGRLGQRRRLHRGLAERHPGRATRRRHLRARTYSSSGTPLAAEFQVNTRTLDNQFHPAVAADADGDFVIAWESNQQEAPAARTESSRGGSTRRGCPGRRVPGQHLHGRHQGMPAVAARADGDFVIAWNSNNQESPGRRHYGIFARRFTSAGVAAGGRVPGQHPHPRCTSATRGRRRQRRRLRRHLGEPPPGRRLRGRVRAPRPRQRAVRARVPGELVHRRRTSLPGGRLRQRRRLRRSPGTARRHRTATPTASSPSASRCHRSPPSTSTATAFSRRSPTACSSYAICSISPAAPSSPTRSGPTAPAAPGRRSPPT